MRRRYLLLALIMLTPLLLFFLDVLVALLALSMILMLPVLVIIRALQEWRDAVGEGKGEGD